MIFLISCSSDDSVSEDPTPTPTPITISATGINVSLDENSVITNDLLGTLTATSNSTEAASYSITSQSPSGAVSINPTTGEITVANAALFDFEANPTISATISVSNSEATTSATATITLSDISDVIFTHLATATNSVDNVTYLDHPDLNNNPDAIIVANHNWTPNGIYNNKVSGVWYDVNEAKWSIYNEDLTDITPDAAYNVLISKDGEAFIHVTTDFSFISTIDNAAINNDPDAIFVVTNNYGANEVYNNNNIGVLYDSSIQKWRVFNEEGVGIPTGSSFNIIAKSDNGTAMVHEATAANITLAGVPQSTAIESITGADRKFVFTHNRASAAEVLDKTFGLYNTGNANQNWAIYTEDASAMPVGIKFNVLIVE